MSDDEPRQRTRWETLKGRVWMFGSLVVAAVIILGFVAAADLLGATREMGVAFAAILGWDALVFRWGVRRFDVTVPKPFREVRDA